MVHKTVLSVRGYSITKSDLSDDEIYQLRKDLTAKPQINAAFNQTPQKFRIYLESPLKLYLPRHYGLNKYGPPTLNKLNQCACKR